MRAGLRSVLVPGWGQLATGRRWLGGTLMVASLVISATLVGVVAVLGPTETVARLADPETLLVVLAANVVVALARLMATTHAWWANGGRNLLMGTTLALLVLSPHAAIAWVGTETRSALIEVFSAPESRPSVATTRPATTRPATTIPPTTSTTTTTTTTTTSTTISTTTAPPSTTSTTRPATTTTTAPFAVDRLDVLLLGGDAGPGRSGLRTDTIMVASVDTATGEAALFGLPRNYGSITFSDGTPFKGRILNEVYGWGQDHPERFGGIDPGASAVRDVAEHLTGLDIDYFMLVDLTGFAEVVDAFGGVTLTVPEPVDGPLYDPQTGDYTMIHIPAGKQALDGGQALAYARVRHDSNDYVRMGRQRCLLAALVEQANAAKLIARLPALLDTMQNHLTTDVPVDMVPDLIRLGARLKADQIRVVGFGPRWGLGRNRAGYVVPDIERIRATVTQTISTPAGAGSPLAGEACQ